MKNLFQVRKDGAGGPNTSFWISDDHEKSFLTIEFFGTGLSRFTFTGGN